MKLKYSDQGIVHRQMTLMLFLCGSQLMSNVFEVKKLVELHLLKKKSIA